VHRIVEQGRDGDARFPRTAQVHQVRVEFGQDQRGANELSAGAEVPLRDVDGARVVLVFSSAQRK
jgi:hypothetical protein